MKAYILCAVLCLSIQASAAEYVDVVRNGGFDLATTWKSGTIPPGWTQRTTPHASQQVRITPRDDGGYCLSFQKVNADKAAYHRIVQKLHDLTLYAGQTCILEADVRVIDAPANQTGLSVGISTDGGHPRAHDGHHNWIDAAFVTVPCDAGSLGTWVPLKVQFTPDRDITEPWVMLTQTAWAKYPYQVEVDNVRLKVPAISLGTPGTVHHNKATALPSRTILVTPRTPMLVEQQAADTLQHYLQTVTGRTIAVYAEDAGELPAGPDVVRVDIGRTARAATLLAQPPLRASSQDDSTGDADQLSQILADLPSDGFIIDARPGQVVIVGRDDRVPFAEKDYTGIQGISERLSYADKYKIAANGQTGTLFAVHELLRRYAGVEWYWPGELGQVVPSSPDGVHIPLGRITDGPDFSMRYFYAVRFSSDPEAALWYRRAGFGMELDPGWPNHSSSLVAGIPNAVQEHPEWFAVYDGKTDPGRLAWGNEELADVYTRLALEHFREHPDSRMFRVMPSDGVKPSHDPLTQAKLDWSDGIRGGNGLMSVAVFDIVNEVARRVSQEFPDRKIGCCAYAKYLKPPKNRRTMHPNVAIMFCAMTPFMYPHGQYMSQIHSYQQSWFGHKVTDFTLWDYLLIRFVRSNGRHVPFVVPHMIGDRYKPLADNIRGGFFQIASAGRVPRLYYCGSQHLNWHVLGRLCWNIQADVDLLIAEYARRFFGPADRKMVRFWDIQEQAWMARKDPVQWSYLLMGRWNHVYTPDVLEDMFAVLDEARSIAEQAARHDVVDRIDVIAEEYALLRTCSPSQIQQLTEEDFIPDGSFESAAHWGFGEGAGIEVMPDAPFGRRAVRLADNLARVHSSVYPFEKGAWYCVSVSMHAAGNGPRDTAEASPTLWVGNNSQAIRPNNRPDWQRVFTVFKATGPDRIWIRGGNGFTTWADGVTVVRLSDEEVGPQGQLGGWNTTDGRNQ